MGVSDSPHSAHLRDQLPISVHTGSWEDAEAFVGSLTHRGLSVHTLRSPRMYDRHSLFQEFAAAYQFPGWFLGGWDAFEDCMTDLDWLGETGGHVAVLTGAEALLFDDAEALTLFPQVMTDISISWSAGEMATIASDRWRLRARFQTVLFTDDPALLASRWPVDLSS